MDKLKEKGKKMSRLIDADALNTLSWENVIEAVLAVENAPIIQQPEWISSDERLPTAEDADESGNVYIFEPSGLAYLLHYEVIRDYSKKAIYHWMPYSVFPQPPTEGE